MLSRLKASLGHADADYAEVFHEMTRSQAIAYENDTVRAVSSNKIQGARVKALKGGGIAWRSCNRLEHLDDAIRECCQSAAAIGKYSVLKEGMVAVEPIKDTVKPSPKINPADISFDEKKELVRKYIEIVRKAPFVQKVTGSYSERFSTETIVNSEGTEISQDIILCSVGIRIIGKDGGRVETASCGFGYDADYSRLLNREAEIENKLEVLESLLKAKNCPSGIFDIVCDQYLAAIFVHEAFGHLSEADDTVNNPSLKKELTLGRMLGQPILNIVDDGTLPGAPGTYKYDHEGVPAENTPLIKKGELVGRLNSRATAFHLDPGKPTGNYRAASYCLNPLTRQSNICIEPGESSFGEMVASIKDGLYLCGGKGGQTMGDIFTFGCQYGYVIKDGKVADMVAGCNISGDVYKTLGQISAVGNDFLVPEFGGCGKSRAAFYYLQMLSKSGLASPHIKIENVVVGGGE